MSNLVLKIAATSLLLFSASVMADSTADAKMHMMKTCMHKQKSNNSKMSAEQMKEFSTDTINKQKVSSGPQDGTLDVPHK